MLRTRLRLSVRMSSSTWNRPEIRSLWAGAYQDYQRSSRKERGGMEHKRRVKRTKLTRRQRKVIVGVRGRGGVVTG